MSATGMAATTWRTTAYMVSGSNILNFKSSVIPLIVKRIAKEQTSGKVKSDRSSYNVIFLYVVVETVKRQHRTTRAWRPSNVGATNRKEGE